MIMKFKQCMKVAGVVSGLVFGWSFLSTIVDASELLGGNGTEIFGPPPPLIPAPLPPLYGPPLAPVPAGPVASPLPDYRPSTFSVFVGTGVALFVVPVFQNWLLPGAGEIIWEHLGRFSLPRFCRFLYSPITNRFGSVDWHNFGRWRSSESMDIRDLFYRQWGNHRIDPDYRRLLSRLDQALVGGGCHKFPVVSDRNFDDDNPSVLLGYSYSLVTDNQPVASVTIVRKVYRRTLSQPLQVGQKRGFYPLHRQLESRALGVLGIEQQVIQALPNDGPYLSFRENVVERKVVDQGAQRVQCELALQPLNARRQNAFLKFSGISPQPNVGEVLGDILGRYRAADRNNVLRVNDGGTVIHLSLNAAFEGRTGERGIDFDLYFRDHRPVAEAPAIPVAGAAAVAGAPAPPADGRG